MSATSKAMAQRMMRRAGPPPPADSEDESEELPYDDEDVDSEDDSDLEQDSADDMDDDDDDEGKDCDSGSDLQDSEQEDSEEEELDDAIAQLEKNLAEVPFEELQALRSKIGTKAFAQLRQGAAKEKTTKGSSKEEREKRKHNAPTVQSSKKPVGITRDVVEPMRPKARDPRFDKAAGKLNEDLFRKSYGFVREYREKEVEALREALKKTKNEERREEIKRTLAVQQSILDRSKKDEERRRVKAEYRKTERELVRRGKQPYFLKKSDEKTVELVSKYEDLKKRGQLDRALEKRAKRNAAKDHRYMPYSRRAADE